MSVALPNSLLVSSIIQDCIGTGATPQSIEFPTCVCTTDNLSQLEACVDCAISDATIPAASAEQITNSVGQIQAGCGETNNTVSEGSSMSGMMSAFASGSGMMASTIPTSSMSMVESSAAPSTTQSESQETSSAAIGAASAEPTSAAMRIGASVLALVGMMAALVL